MQESDYKGQIAFIQQMADFEAAVKTRLDSEETSKLEELTAQDPGYATDEQLSQMSQYSEQAKELIQNGKYKQFEALAAEWKEYAAQAAAKKNGIGCICRSVRFFGISKDPPVSGCPRFRQRGKC